MPLARDLRSEGRGYGDRRCTDPLLDQLLLTVACTRRSSTQYYGIYRCGARYNDCRNPPVDGGILVERGASQVARAVRHHELFFSLDDEHSRGYGAASAYRYMSMDTAVRMTGRMSSESS